MEHTATAQVEHHESGGTKEVWKITGWLSVLTIIELALGFWMIGMPLEQEGKRMATKIVIIVLMMFKAYLITGYFMHLKHEIKNMIMTIVVPLCLFIWFIIAFLYEGNSFKNLRNTYDGHFKEQKDIKAKTQHHHEEGKEEHKAEEKGE